MVGTERVGRGQVAWRGALGVFLGAMLLLNVRSAEARARHRIKPVENSSPSSPEASTSGTAASGTGVASGELSLAAQGAIVIDAFSGKPIFEKNADAPFFPASTTKILTALLVIEEGNLDREVIIQPEDTKVEPSAIEFHPGEHYTRREMLYALLLKSANDVAQALARDNAGSIEAFAEKMTRRAAELGATGSHFMNPHGLHNPKHYTTPRDLALIARTAMQQPLFRQIVSTQEHTWISPAGPVHLTNHNRLLHMFPGCTGIKTGYTVPAQQVLASAARWGTREAIAVVMHTDKPGIWVDSKALLTFALTQTGEPRPLVSDKAVPANPSTSGSSTPVGSQ